jgi:hypothetical protein
MEAIGDGIYTSQLKQNKSLSRAGFNRHKFDPLRKCLLSPMVNVFGQPLHEGSAHTGGDNISIWVESRLKSAPLKTQG